LHLFILSWRKTQAFINILWMKSF